MGRMMGGNRKMKSICEVSIMRCCEEEDEGELKQEVRCVRTF